MAKPIALGCQIFAGGFTLGVSDHFRVLAHLELNSYGVASTKLNFPRLPVYASEDSWPLADLKRERIDFVYGNPPCAAWSNANGRKSDHWRKDPRPMCTRKHFNLIEALRPKVWAWESVVGAFTKGKEFVDDLTRLALDQGYSVTYLLHDAQWLGVPQIRKRFFMVAHRIDIPWKMPSFTHDASAAEILAGVKRVKGQEFPTFKSSGFTPKQGLKILADVPPGGRLRDAWERFEIRRNGKLTVTERGTVKGRPTFGMYRVKTEGPANAIVGYKVIHPTEHRILSVQECQVLSGFPAGYLFEGTGPDAKLSLIARGVCPPVGSWLAANVARGVRADKRAGKPKVHMLDIRKPPGIYQSPYAWQESLPWGGVAEPVADQAKRSGPKGSARTPKPAKVKVPRTPREVIDYDRLVLPKTYPKPNAGETSGAYVRRLLQLGKYADEELAAMVRAQYEGRKTTLSDIYWNRRKLVTDEGVTPPERIHKQLKFA